MSKKEFKEVKVGGASSAEFFNPTKLAKEIEAGDREAGVLFEGVFQKYVEEERKSKDGRPFTAKFYVFEGDNGMTYYLNAFGHLNKRMDEVDAGDLCRISYLGKVEGYHQSKVEIA